MASQAGDQVALEMHLQVMILSVGKVLHGPPWECGST